MTDAHSLQPYGNLTLWKRDSFAMLVGLFLCRDVHRNRATILSLRNTEINQGPEFQELIIAQEQEFQRVALSFIFSYLVYPNSRTHRISEYVVPLRKLHVYINTIQSLYGTFSWWGD
jgi:hypothetical protein